MSKSKNSIKKPIPARLYPGIILTIKISPVFPEPAGIFQLFHNNCSVPDNSVLIPGNIATI